MIQTRSCCNITEENKGKASIQLSKHILSLYYCFLFSNTFYLLLEHQSFLWYHVKQKRDWLNQYLLSIWFYKMPSKTPRMVLTSSWFLGFFCFIIYFSPLLRWQLGQSKNSSFLFHNAHFTLSTWRWKESTSARMRLYYSEIFPWIGTRVTLKKKKPT